MKSTLAKTTSERKYSLGLILFLTCICLRTQNTWHELELKKNEFGHRLNEAINSSSLNVPEKQI